MIGIWLAGLSSACSELSDSIGKRQVGIGTASFYTFGFLNLLIGTMILLGLGIWRHDFYLSLASLPTLIPRIILEILQAHMTVLAVVKADRSDFGPIRILTVPLLLVVDMLLGYVVTPLQMVGVGLITLTIALLLLSEKFRARGSLLVLFTAVNAVATISLYKYDITHFNSVETEQIVVQLILLIYFFVLASVVAKENPFSYLRTRTFALQTGASGLASVIATYAYLFAPASIITASLRASSVLLALVSGTYYFKEKHILVKVLVACGIIVGLLLLI